MTPSKEAFLQELWDAGDFDQYAAGIAKRAEGYELLSEFYIRRAKALRETSNWRPACQTA